MEKRLRSSQAKFLLMVGSNGWVLELEDIGKGEKTPLAKTVCTCQQLLKVEPALWTFVTTEGVEPTNNAAERALRLAVLWRKNSFGSGMV